MSAAARVQASFERSEPVPGVILVTERMPFVRSAAIGVWIGAGSRDEAPEAAGSSHLLEHLLFKGTHRRSARDIAEAFDAVGGEINAYSVKEHTCLYCRVLDTDVALAIDMLADMSRNATLHHEDLESERKVVCEEIRMNADTPDDRVHELFEEALWPDHPLGRPVTGTEESVGALDRATLETFYRAHYAPGRLVVSAAGNVDHQGVERMVRDALQGSAAAGVRTLEPPPAVQRRAVYEARSTEQVHLVWGGAGMPRHDPDRYALAVLSTLFGGGMSSRLFQEVREERGLVYSIYSYHHLYADSGLFAVYAGTSESHAKDVLGIVREQAAKLVAGNVSVDEVERAKGHVKGGLVLSMDDPGGRMSRLGRGELLEGELLRVDELLDRVDQVQPDDVTGVAARLFGSEDLVLACVGPMSPGSLDEFVEPLQ